MDKNICRESAKRLYGEALALYNKPFRDENDNFRLIHSAHASACFWALCGTPLHIARGERFISRVYTRLSMPEAALIHAKRSITICEENGLRNAETALSYDVLARAALESPNYADYVEYKKCALDLAGQIEDSNERAACTEQINASDAPGEQGLRPSFFAMS